jgi:predicted phage tail protein
LLQRLRQQNQHPDVLSLNLAAVQHDNVKAHITQNSNVSISSMFEPRLVGAASAGSSASKTVIKAAFLGPGLLLGAAATAGMALYGRFSIRSVARFVPVRCCLLKVMLKQCEGGDYGLSI